MKKYAIIVFAFMLAAFGCSDESQSSGAFPPDAESNGGSQNPTVQIIRPSPCQRIRGDLIVNVQASDDGFISHVVIQLNNVTYSILFNSPYYVNIPQALLPFDGTYILQALVYDTEGNNTVAEVQIRLDNNTDLPNILVVDSDADPLGLGGPHGAVFRINTDSGKVCTLASSPLFSDPVSIAIQPGTDGTIWVSDRTADLNGTAQGTGAIFRVDPDKYNTVDGLLTDTKFVVPAGLDVTANTIYLADQEAKPVGSPAVFAINPITLGVTTLVSSGSLKRPNGILIDGSDLWIVDKDADFIYGSELGEVFKYNPYYQTGGMLTRVAASGLFKNPSELVSDGAGGFILSDSGAFGLGLAGQLFAIDPLEPDPKLAATPFCSGESLVTPSGVVRWGSAYLVADRNADYENRGAIVLCNASSPWDPEVYYYSELFVNPYDLVISDK